MKRLSLIIVVLMVCAKVMAHNPQIVTYTIRNQYNVWFIEASFPQVSVQNALNNKYGEDEVSNYDKTTYRNKIVEIFRNAIQLTANNRQLILGNAAIKPGSHQTDVKFVIENFPNQTEEFNLIVEIESLPFNKYQQNVVRVLASNKMERQVLSKANGFKGAFMINAEGVFKLDIKEQENDVNTLMLSIILVFSIITLAVVMIKNKDTKAVST